jgi:hypothetical protein
MRYTRIEVGGGNGAIAALSRAEGSDTIEVEIDGPRGRRRIQISAGGTDGGWRDGAAVHDAVEGRRGTQGDIAPYAHAIELLADQ